MFDKVLIANRGEIAVRIARTLQAMDITAVAVHSTIDRGAMHVGAADEAYELPGATSLETYLRGDLIIEIAKSCGAQAIHPGYGFLSENAGFAEACAAAGITFIGPPPEAIRAMGDKIEAKARMDSSGVPTLPGWSSDEAADAATLTQAAADVGYPLLVKAAAGGGGKGMRVVDEASGLDEAIAAAQREAGNAFGDDRVFFERYLRKARHVEVQVLADTHGNAVHLWERECSIQRRHQKVVEEAPSPVVDDALRAKMGAAGVAAAKAIDYVGAGTVEFMLEESGDFHFLEMNTRLQVEHPVTELILRRDLVAEQVRVAAGEPLSFTQDDLVADGHAIEVRIYAEDPARGFLPSTGTVVEHHLPAMPNVRLDAGMQAGSEVSVHYDPMLSKLIAWGGDREDARKRLLQALRRYVVLGVTTNIPFLERVLAHEAFISGDLHTGFLDEHTITVDSAPASDAALIAAALAAREAPAAGMVESIPGPWDEADSWRIG